jgi:hypothetical protein
MRKLASIQRIIDISPIENADNIVLAKILGWNVVVKKNEFNIGDFCVYCEIDSILPIIEEFSFLETCKYRIKTRKLRGVYSQGIAFPISTLSLFGKMSQELDLVKIYENDTNTEKSIFIGDKSYSVNELINEVKNQTEVGKYLLNLHNEVMNDIVNSGKLFVKSNKSSKKFYIIEDEEVTELMDIVKYDPESEIDPIEKPDLSGKTWIERKYKKYRWLTKMFFRKIFGIPTETKAGNWPSFLRKTDECRVQTIQKSLNINEGKIAYITEKAEGTSSTYFVYNGKFGVCSRNRIVRNRDDVRWQMAKKYDLERKLVSLNRNIAAQGEVVGARIQGNIYGIDGNELRIFLILDLDTKVYLGYDETMKIINELELPFVPVIETGHIIKTDIDYYVQLSKGKSKINPKKEREGIVIRLMNEDFSFKSVNPDYLIKQE